MDLRATAGLALIAAALVLGSVALASGNGGKSGFLSLPRRKQDWLRLLLVALAAFIVSVQLFSGFGYSIPVFGTLDSKVVLVYPLVLLGAGSVAALFVERRSGIVFSVISVLLGMAVFSAGKF